MMDIKRNDKVRGSFGVGIVTDIADGFLTDKITEEPVGKPEELVRILQYRGDKPVYSYVNRTEIEEIVE